ALQPRALPTKCTRTLELNASKHERYLESGGQCPRTRREDRKAIEKKIQVAIIIIIQLLANDKHRFGQGCCQVASGDCKSWRTMFASNVRGNTSQANSTCIESQFNVRRHVWLWVAANSFACQPTRQQPCDPSGFRKPEGSYPAHCHLNDRRQITTSVQCPCAYCAYQRNDILLAVPIQNIESELCQRKKV